MKCLFEGTGVALVTPFTDDAIDYEAVKKLIEGDISKGAKAIIVLATTGEGSTITDKERRKLITLAVKQINGRAKLIVGTGHNCFKKCLENTMQAKKLGADGALVVTPYYNKTSQRGIVEYYDALAKLEFPMIMYNVPARTGLSIELATVKKILSKNKFICGIKESTTDIVRIKKLCAICENKIPVYSGEDALNFVFYCLGGRGAISVTANICADKVERIYRLVKEGNTKLAREEQNQLSRFDEALFVETNPVPVKYFMSLSGQIKADVRKPLVQLMRKNKRFLKSLYEKTKEEI